MKQQGMTLKNCPKCREDFKPKRKEQKFCSWDCAWNNRIKKECEVCGRVMMVYPCLIDRKRFCSMPCKHKGVMTPEVREKIRKKLELPDDKLKDVRVSKRIKRWSKAVFAANKKVCTTCGSRKQLVAHHVKNIIDFPSLRYKVSNGIILCRSCHARIHRHVPDHRFKHTTI